MTQEGNYTIKFSIITVVFNGEAYIQETISSVLQQDYKNVEYIIIDGGSTDKTLSIIKPYLKQLHHFISELDNGMYHAINKGIEKATGDYILILNADDYLYQGNTLSEIQKCICKKNYNFFYCNIIRRKDNLFRKIRLKKYSLQEVLASEHCTFIPHPSFFISRKYIEEFKLIYDLKYKYASDFDYILTALKMSNNNYNHVNIFSTVFRDHPNSITSSGKINSERLSILDKWQLKKIPFLKQLALYYFNWIIYKMKSSERY